METFHTPHKSKPSPKQDTPKTTDKINIPGAKAEQTTSRPDVYSGPKIKLPRNFELVSREMI